MIDLHYWTTPNGHKISICLEEMRLAYKIVPVDISKDQQFTTFNNVKSDSSISHNCFLQVIDSAKVFTLYSRFSEFGSLFRSALWHVFAK